MLKIADFSEFSYVMQFSILNVFFTFLGTKLFTYEEKGAANLTSSCDHENHAKVANFCMILAIFNIFLISYLWSDFHVLGVFLYLIWNRKTI